jgi:phosphatidate cytidylyltransferase
VTEDARPPGGRRQRKVRSRADLEASVAEFEARTRAANERLTARSGRNLPVAIGVGILLGAALLASLLIVKELFMLFALVMLVTTALELGAALRVSGRTIPRAPVVALAALIVPLSFYGLPFLGVSRDGAHWLGTLVGILLISAWRLVELVLPTHRRPAREIGLDLLGGVFIAVYIAFFGSFAVLLTGADGGQWWVLAFLIVVVTTDTGAYVAGLLLGRHKLAPTISPGKTWEGFAGSVVAAIVAGQILAPLMLQQPWWVGLILSLVMVATATGGDLAESLLKRDLGVKDISSWLPGHGGLLDRLDSTLLSAAAAYALFVIFA